MRGGARHVPTPRTRYRKVGADENGLLETEEDTDLEMQKQKESQTKFT